MYAGVTCSRSPVTAVTARDYNPLDVAHKVLGSACTLASMPDRCVEAAGLTAGRGNPLNVTAAAQVFVCGQQVAGSSTLLVQACKSTRWAMPLYMLASHTHPAPCLQVGAAPLVKYLLAQAAPDVAYAPPLQQTVSCIYWSQRAHVCVAHTHPAPPIPTTPSGRCCPSRGVPGSTSSA
jgi:hypothetical protein